MYFYSVGKLSSSSPSDARYAKLYNLPYFNLFSFSCKIVDFIRNCSPSETKACNELKNPRGLFSNCLRKLGSSANHYYQSCMIDVCANKDLPKIQKIVVLQSYEALASKCDVYGITVKWRSIFKYRELNIYLSFAMTKKEIYVEFSS